MLFFDILLGNMALLDSQKDRIRDYVGFDFYLSYLLTHRPCLDFICYSSLISSLSLDEGIRTEYKNLVTLSCGTSVINVYMIESLRQNVKKLLTNIW